MMESCDIYIKSLIFENLAWLDNPDDLLDQIYNNLNEISNFYFVSLSLNMAQVYNVNLKEQNYDSMIIYLKGVKYKHEEFIDKDAIIDLEDKIKEQLYYIEGLDFGEIEIRSSKIYTDRDLGIFEQPLYSHIKKPLYIEKG